MTTTTNSGSYVFPDGSLLVKARNLAWSEWLAPGTRFRLLDIDHSFNKMTMLIEADAGAVIDGYRQSGAGEYFVEIGVMESSRGVLGVGDYLFQPGGTSLQQVRFPVPSQIYVIFHGPLQLYLAAGKPAHIADMDWHIQKAEANGAAEHLQRD
ncbi:MAG: hypothetical protein HY066_10585 [Betaproteobacteria bacterium]|nr:hypothetical protein [Betaproteobacteria bacterium]